MKNNFNVENGSRHKLCHLCGISILFMTTCTFGLFANEGYRSGESSTSTVVYQQNKVIISGTIVDSNGETIIGANVVEKGTTNGTITDLDGNFVLNVPQDAVLEISYIGYISQSIKASSIKGKIILKENNQVLDEVVVIGYGTTKREDFTGSVSSVNLENSPISLSSNMNALESLKGNVTGLDIGATNSAGGEPSIQMRGQKSISGSNNPLIVLDGVIFMGSINDINPNDIASFDVLKDATSAAAYGSRSANGVIIITTKKGRSGKPTITLNTTGTMQTWNNKPDLMDGEHWLNAVVAKNNLGDDLSFLKPQEIANMDAGNQTDWLDESSRTGWIQDYQLAVSGAGDKMNYYLSANYTKNKGIVVGDDYDRISVLAKINTDITDWLQIGVDAGYTNHDYSGIGADIFKAAIVSPYGSMYYEDHNIEKFPTTQSAVNPLWGVSDGSVNDIDERNNFRANAHLVLKCPWIEGLSYRFNYAGNLSKNRETRFYHEGYYVREGEIYETERYSPESLQLLLTKANGYIDNQTTESWVIDNILNYKKKFGKHSIDLTAVGTSDHTMYRSEKMSGSDFAANGNTILGVNGLSYATVQKNNLSGYERSNIGYLGRASYAYDNKYFLTGSYRRDGASVFGANYKWGNFSAVGFAWKISNESFMESTKEYLNSLKLKASWGKNGNQGIGPYGTLSTVINGQSGGIRYEFGGSDILYGLNVNALGNADLGWEKTQSWNIGFESAWFENRLFLDVDAYFSKTTDQIFTRNIPIMTGFKTVKASMGQINNHGIEATVRTVNIENKDWYWGTNLTFWLNRNKLVHLYGDDIDGDGKEDDDIGNSRFIGKPIGSIYGYKQDGVVQEDDVAYIEANGVKPGSPKYVDIDGDGKISSADRDILGYATPNFKINVSNTVSYKNWDLYAMITGTFGGNGYFQKSNSQAYIVSYPGLALSNNIYIPWWTPENRSNKYLDPTFSGDGKFNGLQNRGFIRLQDVIISYTFKDTWIEKAKMNKLKVFLSAKNLLTITNWEGEDPETGAGVLSTTYPVATSFSLGLNVSF